MRLFFHKHPLLCFVLAVCVYTAAKGAFFTVFDSSEQHTAQAEIRQAIGAIAGRQVALEEHDVLAAIRLFRNTSRHHPPSSRKSSRAISTLGLITGAQAAQTSAQLHPHIFKNAGFASYEQVPGVLASVSLGVFVLALNDSQATLRKEIANGEKLAADPKIEASLRGQIKGQLSGLTEQLQMISLMAETAKVLPRNLELVKQHRRAIVEAISAARA